MNMLLKTMRENPTHPPSQPRFGRKRTEQVGSKNNMNAACSWLVCCLLLIVVCSGCKTMSHVAYAIGHVLDPDTCQCPADATDCALCGVPPRGTPELYGNPYPQMPPGTYPPASAGPGPSEARPAYAGYQAGDPAVAAAAGRSHGYYQSGPPGAAPHPMVGGQHFQAGNVSDELTSRNRELIQANSHLQLVQNEVADVRREMVAWRQGMVELQQQLQERDRKRRDELGEVVGSVAKLVEDANQ